MPPTRPTSRRARPQLEGADRPRRSSRRSSRSCCWLAPRGGETTFRLSTADRRHPAARTSSCRSMLTAWVVLRAARAAGRGIRVLRAAPAAASPLWIVIVVHRRLRRRLPHLGGGRRRRIPVAGPARRLARPRVPLIYGALGGVIGERVGRRQHRDRGSAAGRRLQRGGRRHGRPGMPILGLLAAMVAGVLVALRARGVRDQVPRRPGDRRRRAQRARHRADELPLLAGAAAQRRRR